MGLFDGVFNTGPQQAAADAQAKGIQSGIQQLIPSFQQGQTDLRNTTGNAQGALYNTYGQGRDALQQNYMAGISPFLQNYAQANQGSNALANALGLNGAAGNAAAIQAFRNNPGYQFGLQQGEDAIAAQAQKAGMGASGNALNAAGQFATNYANQNWNNYINQLQPYLGFATQGAGGVQQGYTGLGSGLNQNLTGLGQGVAGSEINLGQLLNQSQMEKGKAIYGADTSIGNAYANADLAQAQANNNLWGGLGNLASAVLKMGSPTGKA